LLAGIETAAVPAGGVETCLEHDNDDPGPISPDPEDDDEEEDEEAAEDAVADGGEFEDGGEEDVDDDPDEDDDDEEEDDDPEDVDVKGDGEKTGVSLIIPEFSCVIPPMGTCCWDCWDAETNICGLKEGGFCC